MAWEFFKGMLGAGEGGSATLAAVDAGSAAVRALGFSLTKEHRIHIVRENSTPTEERLGLNRKEALETGRLAERIQKALFALGRGRGYGALAVSFGDGFLRTTTYEALFERGDPKEKIDIAEFKNFLEKTEREAKKELDEKFSAERGGGELVLLDSQLTGFSLDGYRIADPVGLAGRELAITLFNTYTEEIYADFLRDLQKRCGVKKLLPTSGSYAIWRALAPTDIGEPPFSGILIGVGERETRVAAAAHGRFIGAKTFAVGCQAFTRRIGLHLALGQKEAEQVRAQYAEGTLSAPVSRKISSILKNDLECWTRSVGLALQEFSHAIDLFPSSLMLFGEGSTLPGIASSLEERDDLLSVPFLEKRSIALIEPHHFPLLRQGELPSQPAPAQTEMYALACFLAQEHATRTEMQRLIRQAAFLVNQQS